VVAAATMVTVVGAAPVVVTVVAGAAPVLALVASSSSPHEAASTTNTNPKIAHRPMHAPLTSGRLAQTTSADPDRYVTRRS
jgi:hypothetical protein